MLPFLIADYVGAAIDLHTLDFAGLVNAYYSSTGGLSTQLVASDWVNLVASAIGIVTALILLLPKHYPQIMELWKEKWSR